jgi:hypothetical protein
LILEPDAFLDFSGPRYRRGFEDAVARLGGAPARGA